MADKTPKPLFYGDAHPELVEIAGDDHAHLSRLIGVKLAGLAIERAAQNPADPTQMERAITHKAMMEEELARYQAQHEITQMVTDQNQARP